jgi:hypothetical protein
VLINKGQFLYPVSTRLLPYTLLLSASALSGAEQPCPWLNQATANGILEGTATAANTKSACAFSGKNGDLRIEVTVAPDAATRLRNLEAACRIGAKPLKAIGNETATCSSAGVEQIVGRVRDQLFIITLTMKSFNQQEVAKRGRLVAEQVSGNLF